ncbi:MAG: bile acid:sodium symporter family protein [Pirellulales bacterium]|nr:bile acid:sodium symporter family protein [Pirellulales bacterium]
MLERFLLLWLTLLGVLAFFWTQWFPGVWDPFVGTSAGLSPLFAVTMLAIGSLLPRDEIRQVIRRWPTVLGGTAVQYAAMPLLAYGLARLFGLEGPALVGVLMAGCVPGAMASNVLTMVARGNVSYSVSLTTSATLFSPIMVPLALGLALGTETEGFPAADLIWELCWMVVLPVVAGHFLSRRYAIWSAVARRVGAIIANLTILWIIAVVVANNRESLSQLESRLLLALLGLNVGGYLAGTAGSFLLRLPAPMRRALTLEVGMQNAGLGTVLATRLFGDACAVAPALYTFGCMFTGTILARLWAVYGGNRPPEDDTERAPA